MYFPSRWNEIRPWTVPTKSEASVKEIEVYRSLQDESSREWFAVHNPRSSALNPSFTLPGPDWKLYAVSQLPTLADPQKATNDSTGDTRDRRAFQIVPAVLSPCTGTNVGDAGLVAAYKCEGFPVDAFGSRLYVLEMPKTAIRRGHVKLFARLGDSDPLRELTVKMKDEYAAARSQNALDTGLVWSDRLDVIASSDEARSNVFARLRAQGVTHLPILMNITSASDAGSDAGPRFEVTPVTNEGTPIAANEIAAMRASGILPAADLWTAPQGACSGEVITCAPPPVPDGEKAYSRAPQCRPTDILFYSAAYSKSDATSWNSGPDITNPVAVIDLGIGSCDTTKWIPKAGELVSCLGGGVGRIGAVESVSQDSGMPTFRLLLDIPMSAPCEFETGGVAKFYPVRQAGPVANAIARQNGSKGDAFCDVPGDFQADLSSAGQACPTWDDIDAELRGDVAAHSKLWPLACQRPLVEPMKAEDLELGTGTVRPKLYLRCRTPAVVNGQATTVLDGSGCRMWNQLNEAQASIVKQLVDAVLLGLGDTPTSTERYKNLIIRPERGLDEAREFGRRSDFFTGYGQSHLMAIASAMEATGVRTANTNRGAYFEIESDMRRLGQVNGAPDRWKSFIRMTHGTPMNGQLVFSPWLTRAYHDRAQVSRPLFYNGGYSFQGDSHYARAPGLVRRYLDTYAPKGTSAQVYGNLFWNNYRPEKLLGGGADPIYVSGCTTNNDAKSCYVGARDWLDFGSGGAMYTELPPLFLPGLSSTNPQKLDQFAEETFRRAMLVEALRDQRVLRARGVTPSEQDVQWLDGSGPFSPVSACTYARIRTGSGTCADR